MGKKKKAKKILVEQILDKAKIEYESIVFANYQGDASLITHQAFDEATTYKTLALTGNQTGPIIGIVPVREHLSYKKLANVSGNKKVGMIPQKDLEQTTGYIHGANNPVGIYQTKKFPIFIDKSAQARGWLIVSAGEVGRSIKINAKDLADFVSARFDDIVE